MNGLTGTVANLYNALEPDLKISIAKGKNFEMSEDLISKIKAVEGVKIISKTLMDKALIKNVDKQVLVSIKGIDENFNKITQIDSSIIDGKFELNDSAIGKIILGEGIAGKLQINLKDYGDELILFSPARGEENLNPADNLNQVNGHASGIFSLNEELNNQFAFVSLATARKLFDQPNKLSAIEIACEKGKEDAVRKKIKEILGDKFVVKDRYELNDVLFRTLETEKLATFIILAFILIIATFNIIGALTMLIIEKRKDIKTLYSMGANLSLIRNIFMREGFLITCIGALIGLVLGLLVCWIQIQFHVVKFGDEYIVPYWPIEMQLKDFIWIFGLIMIIGFFAALYPVRVFTKMDLVH